MAVAQIIAVAIFVIMFGLIISEKVERHIVTLVAALVTILGVFVIGLGVCNHDFSAAGSAILDTLNVKNIFTTNFWYESGQASEESSGINWATIIFIAGMMVMVEGMARVGFFRWLCMRLAKLVKYKVVPIFIVFMVMSAVLSMFIDSITVILFLAAVTIELAQLLSLIVIVFYFLLVFKKDLKPESNAVNPDDLPEPKTAILDFKGFIVSCVIFACAVVLLVTHAQTGLTVATIGVFIAFLTLVTAPKHIGEMLKKVDYKTLLFFIGLFVVVGGLEQTGVLKLIASFIEHISGGNAYIMVAIIIWVSAVASAFVDNIPFAATMVPVISGLAGASGISIQTLAWALSIGTDIGGSATPIGASANVVGTSVAAKHGYKIGWGKYCVKAVPATIIVLVMSTAILFARYL